VSSGRQSPLSVALWWQRPRDAVDEEVTAAVGADMTHCHRLEGLVLPLDDHERPQSSSTRRVTAGALGFFSFTQSRERPD
jgi:hypothetical protein